MTITELINQDREKHIQHERALREIAALTEKVCTHADLHLVASAAYHRYGEDAEHVVRLWPNGEHKSKTHYKQVLSTVLPIDWEVEADTGQAWIDVSGTLNGYRLGMAIYTK